MAGLVLTLDNIQPLLILLVRAALGFGLAFSFSMVAVAFAWGMYVFAGATSQITLLALFTSGAGIGAGMGNSPLWLSVNYNTLSVIVRNVAISILAGVGGAWGGYWYSAHQVVECCAKPGVAPFTIVALGAAVVAGVVGLALGIARRAMVKKSATATRRI
jgi:hypothetical protein